MITRSSQLIRFNAATGIVSALLLFAIVVGCYLFGERTVRQAEDAFAAGDVNRRIANVFISLIDAESSQRGFLLTQDEAYLGPFNAARKTISDELATLRSAMRALPADSNISPIDPLSDIVARKFAELDRTVDLAKTGRRDEAIEVVNSDLGKTITDEARAYVAAVRVAAGSFRDRRLAQMRESASTLTFLTILGVVATIALSIFTLMQIREYAREIEAARSKLARVNEDLEKRVDLRTRDLLRANDEIQRYAYIVSHDLRAPLVNIMGFTSELDQIGATVAAAMRRPEVDRSDPQWSEALEALERDLPEALGFIKSSSRRMDALINEILRLSRLGRAQLRAEPIDMNALVAECAATLQHRLDVAGARIDIEGRLPDLVGDRSAVQQIVGNLLDNAVKYLSAGRPGAIKVRGSAVAGIAVYEFEDNGRGVAPADQERIFDLFRRAGAQDQPGEGIGLAHVRTLARRMTGEISIQSDGVSGSTFRLGLPQDLRPVMMKEAT